ncbi:MAG TPA: cupin domain-containing protein [Mucilaginibacter sp.]|jgi:mannose-6-phosphate isomerase-like protein (cupin superfamily)|nr:cupin domain-containing protein [Mucilaginibacter sp.]
MKISYKTLVLLALTGSLFFLLGFVSKQSTPGYYIDHEKAIAVDQPGPHDGGGKTTAFPFFDKVKEAKMVFRKRILHPGSSIGYHLQEKQEIYYILSGNGELTTNGKTIPVTSGDAVLTMPGSSHGLKPSGNEDLAVLITYEN